MALPVPEVGLVVHFNYLWRRERDRGVDNARYPRPCAIVVATRRTADGALLVAVAPITHAEPRGGDAALEIPLPIRRHLDLDELRSWVIVDELNEFVWPGHDLQPNAEGEIAYGVLPNRFYQRIRQAVLEAVRTGKLGRVPR